jgi:hypothetical protein
MRSVLLGLMAVVGFSGPALALDVAAKEDGVVVYKDASKKSEEIGSLKRDQVVEALERKSLFWHVKLPSGKAGYVLFTKVNRTEGSSSGLAQAIKDAAHDSRDMDDVKSARSRSAVMGVRGLNEGEQAASAGNVRPNMRMVYQMEDREVGEKNVGQIASMVQKEIEARQRRAGH